MLLDGYQIRVKVPDEGKDNEELDQLAARINDLPVVIEEAARNWVRERIPNATVEVN